MFLLAITQLFSKGHHIDTEMEGDQEDFIAQITI